MCAEEHEHTVRILLTDTGIVLDGQRVEGDTVQHAPWYARASRLGVPVNAAVHVGVSVAVTADSVSGIRFAEIPATLTFEVASHPGTRTLNRAIFDPPSFFSVIRHSWVVAKDTLYFVAWSDRYRPLDGSWYAGLAEDPAFSIIPVLAMVAARAHLANVRMNDGTFCAWIAEYDPTTTVKEAMHALLQRLASVSDEYARLAEHAHHAYDALIKEKVKPVVDAIHDATTGRIREPSIPDHEAESTDLSFAMDEHSRTYTRFPADRGTMEIDAEFLNVTIGDMPPGITVKVNTKPGTACPPFYTLTDIVIHERHVRFRVSATRYVAAARVVETFLDHLGVEAPPPSETEWGKTFEIEVAPDESAIAQDVVQAIVSGMAALAGPATWRAAVERVLRDRMP